MSLFAKAQSFLRNVSFFRRVEADLDDEIQSHLELLTEENLKAGMNPGKAARAAKMQLGGIEQVKEEIRGEMMGNFFNSILSDCRYGLRQLRKAPGFTIVAVLSLALGIGATTAIFSVVYAVLVDPYPYAGADRIGMLHLQNRGGDQGDAGYTAAEFLEMKARSTTAEDMIAFYRRSVAITDGNFPEAAVQMEFSSNGMDFFGVPPLLGREFSARDTDSAAKVEPVAVLSYEFWQRRFAGRREVLGQQIRLNDKFFTVIGVLPARFTWSDADVYVPIEIRRGADQRVGLIMRAKRGMGKDQINAEFQNFHEEFSKPASASFFYPEKPFRTAFLSVSEGILGKFANTLLALLAAVGFLLLIACVNMANLLLARSSRRQGEIGVRITLGAGRRRVIRQLLTESVMLSVAGGVLGVALAYGGVKAVVALLPEYSVPHEAVIAVNVPVLCFAVVVSVLTGILFGIAPALQLTKTDQIAFLKTAGKDAAAGGSGSRLRDALIIVEVTLSLVLLTAAALAGSSMEEFARVKLGYEPKGVLTFYLPMAANRYPEWSQRQAFITQVLEGLKNIPGAESAAAVATGVPPYSGGGTKFNIGGLPPTEAMIRLNVVSDGYFKTIGISLLEGRFFDAGDVTRVSPVAVVSEDLVKKYFPAGQDPVGRQIRLDVFTASLPPDMVKAPNVSDTFEIVGVAATARNSGVRDEPEPAAYVATSTMMPPGEVFAIRTHAEPQTLTAGARAVVSAIDPGAPLTRVRTLDLMLDNSIAYPRFATFLFGIFGAIGLTLACTGIFSVVSYAVSRRTREFGIRMALGATPGSVLRLVLGSTGRVLIVGFVFGVALSVFAGRSLAGKLEGVDVPSPLLLTVVTGVLAVAAFLACAIPARSATRVQPVDALRHE